jgi:hypothetical protein
MDLRTRYGYEEEGDWVMELVDLCQNVQLKEVNDTGRIAPDNRSVSALDLLRNGRNIGSEQAGSAAACYGLLPELSLDSKSICSADGQLGDAFMQNLWTDDVYKWGQRLFQELKNFGYRVEHGLENIKPADLMELAKDLGTATRDFAPAIISDITKVIKSGGLDTSADARLIIDLANFIKSPQAAKIGEDAVKVIKEFQEKFGVKAI